MGKIPLQERSVHPLHWEAAAELPGSNEKNQALGVAGPVTGVHNDVLMVAGGANFPGKMPWDGGKKKYYANIYVFERVENKILLNPNAFKLPHEIAYAACASVPSGIVYAGGENDHGICDEAWLLQWNRNSSSVTKTRLPKLPFAVTNASATAFGNTIYLAGGETKDAVSDKFLFLNLDDSSPNWQALPNIPKPASHSVMVVQSNGVNDCVYLIGGRKRNSNGISDLYNNVFEFDISGGEWKERKPLPYALSAGTGAAYGKEEIILFGGDKGTTFHATEELIAAFNSEKDEQKKSELVIKKSKLQSAHPGFSKTVLWYNTKSNDWVTTDEIPYQAPVTTTAVKWNDRYYIPSGEMKAGVRSPYILSAKIAMDPK